MNLIAFALLIVSSICIGGMAEYMFLSAVLLCPILFLMVKKSVKNNERPKVFKTENIFFISSYAILVAYPEDAHQTRMMVSKPEKVKKIIFKIPV